MSSFNTLKVKGLDRFLVAANLNPEKFDIHISEIDPGTRAHPPHTHDGVEAFYILEGEGRAEIEDEQYELKTNEAIMLDPTRLHGLVNIGTTRMRYMVIIFKP